MIGSRHDLSEYLQIEESECGLMCVAAATAVLGGPISATTARRDYQQSVRGATVGQLCSVLASLNLLSRPVECSLDEIRDLKLPSIIHWNERHFVLLMKVSVRKALIFDPGSGLSNIGLDEVARRFSGKAIQIEPAETFRRSAPRTPIRLGPLITAAQGAKRKILQLLLLSFALQTFALFVPLLSQLTINLGAMEGDVAAVLAISGCVALVYSTNFIVEVWRGVLNQKIASHISEVTARNLFRRLLSLPMNWFERRKVADVASRFDSIEPMRHALSAGLATLVIDGLLGVVLAALLFLVSPTLACIVLATVLAVVLTKAAFSPATSRASAMAATHKIAENSLRWETFRNIQALKLTGAELTREQVWSASYLDGIRATEKSHILLSHQQAVANLIGGLGSLLMILVGAIKIGDGTLSIGVPFAFVMYRRYLTDKVSAAVDQISVFWLLRFHLRRVSEVFDVESEARWNDARFGGETVTDGKIQLVDVAHKHSGADKFIIRGANATFPGGQTVVIVGPSGTGKTTLLRLILGLYSPVSGDIQVDGVSISALGPRHLRKCMAAVLQEDELLAGSIYENVTMFDKCPDLERCIWALEQSEIWGFVRTQPLSVHTPVGEGGRTLSAGQRQRVLLARALYRRANVLVLDEATSNVDPEVESRIFQRLRNLPCTKIVVSHHEGLRQHADYVYFLDERGLRPLERLIRDAVA